MGAQLASRPGSTGESDGKGSPAIDAQWLGMLQRISDRAAHEIRGALNAVSVNVEVVRSRSEKPEALAASVNRFANVASSQLDAVIAMTEALLWLARPAREPMEPGIAVQRIHTLLAPAVRADADGGELELEGTFAGLGVTSASGSAVRLAVGGCLLAAVTPGARVRCSPGSETPPADGEVGVCIERRDGQPIGVDAAVVAAVAESGIHIEAASSAVFIRFPR